LIIDVKQDEREAKEWELGNTREGISLNELAEVATQGLTFCEAYCPSREYTGENRCKCIRERFPTPEHYELYLIARDKYLKMLAITVMAEAVAETEERDK